MGVKNNNGVEFNISDEVKDSLTHTNPGLIDLILETESMDDNERQDWFDTLPTMNEDQVNRLDDILKREKEKLEALEEKYQKDVAELNEKHQEDLEKWKEHQNA